MSQNGYAQYQRSQLLTASPAKLLLASYDGAIRFARIASERMKEKNLYEQNKYINKTLAIVSELMSTLRDDLDPVFSSRLRSLYLYSIKKLAQANLEGDQEALAEVIKILSDLREAWGKAEQTLQQQAIEEAAA
ncbi:flagellar export chaperone FliS [bacterium]|nr:flagellar export chaperone FliS [bacterium]